MVSDYMRYYYAPVHERSRLLGADNAARAQALAVAMGRIQSGWQSVWIGSVEEGPGGSMMVGEKVRIRAQVHLGALTPDDVAVELCMGRLNKEGEIADGFRVQMKTDGRDGDGTYRYVGETAPEQSGLHGFTIRVRPYHPDLAARFIPGLICWADASRLAAGSGR
jgi:starch phosphorylase